MKRVLVCLALVLTIASPLLFAQRTTTQPSAPSGLFTLTIVTNPPTASIFINGQLIKGNTAKLPSGATYKILVQAPGYADFNTSVVLTRDTTIQARLTASGVQLTVTANVAGAQVFLNGSASGTVPLNIQVVPGTYNLVVKAKGYSDFATNFTLNGPQTINAVLQVETFPLSVNSNVKGAIVYLNGSQAGMAPLVLNLVPGNYALVVKASGYEDYSTQILMSSANVINAVLSESFYSLSVSSNVKGAQIFVNGDFAGNAPAVLRLGRGSYKIALKAQGYSDYSAQISLNQSQELFANLEAQLRKLTVEGNVPGAILEISGFSTTTLPFSGFLPPGSYQIQIKAPGYRDYSTTVILNEDRTVKAVLEPMLASFQLLVQSVNANADLRGNHLGQIRLSIDGIEYKGLSGTLRPGEHTFRVVTGGMETTSTFTLEAGKSYTISTAMSLWIKE